jgi:hypothetical protein
MRLAGLVFSIIANVFTVFVIIFDLHALEVFPFQPPTPNIPIVLSPYISAEKSSFARSHAYLNRQRIGGVLPPSAVVPLRPTQGLLRNYPPKITVTTNPSHAKEKYVCIVDNYEVQTNGYTYIAVALVNNHIETYHGPYQPTCVPSLTNPGVINDYRRT